MVIAVRHPVALWNNLKPVVTSKPPNILYIAILYEFQQNLSNQWSQTH